MKKQDLELKIGEEYRIRGYKGEYKYTGLIGNLLLGDCYQFIKGSFRDNKLNEIISMRIPKDNFDKVENEKIIEKDKEKRPFVLYLKPDKTYREYMKRFNYLKEFLEAQI